MSTHNPHVHALYTPRVTAARARIRCDSELAPIVSRTPDPDLLLAFLVEFCARGVAMTEPVEDWITRSGRRCTQTGHPELGRALTKHARQEAGHHELMLADLAGLVARWNRGHTRTVEVGRLLARPSSAATHRYLQLHERTIASDTPYCQLAIEYEIEALSLVLGPSILESCRRALGPEILAQLSFMTEHVRLDAGHTAANEAELDRFLAANEGAADALAQTGVEALSIYLDFLGECVTSGRALVDGAGDQVSTHDRVH